MNTNWTLPLILFSLLLLIACLVCCCLGTGVVTYLAFQDISTINNTSSNLPATNTPVVIRPTPNETSKTPQSTQTPDLPDSSKQHTEIDSNGYETLRLLSEMEVPINDLVNLAQRLEGKTGIALTQEAPATWLEVGTKKSFWVSNTDTNENFQVEAILRYVTDHAYFWIQDGVAYNANDLRDLAETFEDQIYPTNREFFGSEWTPGVDNDPHIYILYAKGMGNSVAGYFSSVDAYPPDVHQYSNWHEMFLFNAENVSFREEFTYGVLAHEFQHMIHWYRDRNEETWLNEGFSELAMLLNNYDVGGHDYVYTRNPDIQLNDWPTDHNTTMPHYGAAFLFTTYFLDRFGEDVTKALVARTENGLDSIDLLLKELGIKDPLTNEIISADDIFQDWVITSYLQDESVGDGRYTYSIYPTAPQPGYTESISNCSESWNTRDVSQYGVDYIRIKCTGNSTLYFEGSTQVGVLPEDAYSGSYAFWSNKGDESNMTLTQLFDFTEQTGELTLSYWNWHDIEKDYDYVYVVASLDGESWEILNTPSGTAENPSGNSFGWAYNGLSGTTSKDRSDARWINEIVDISKFAGEMAFLRFEYVTDAAVNGEGFLIDDISIPQIGYFTDFELDEGGWEAAGFARIQNILPQTYRLALIRFGAATSVEYISLEPDNTIEIPLTFNQDLKEVILVVSGTTRFTRQPTAYRFNFIP